MKCKVFLLLVTIFLTKVTDAQISSYANPSFDVQGHLYIRGNISTLSNSGNEWIAWATRNTSLSEVKIDLSNINNAFFLGNVGIGTNSPVAKLHILDNADKPGLSIQQSGNTNSAAAGIYGQYYGLSLGIGNNSQSYYAFNVSGSVTPIGNGFTGGNTLFCVKGNGNTGIGVYDPSHKLDILTVSGTDPLSLKFNNAGTITTTHDFYDDGNGGTINGNILLYAGNNAKVQLSANNVSYFNGGAFGIGTETPKSWGTLQYLTINGAGGSAVTWQKGGVEKAEIYYSGDKFGISAEGQICLQPISGNVSIGTSNADSRFKLNVEGTIRASEVKVCLQGGCDFVFKSNYKLMGLHELEKFIKTNQHLPEIAPEKEMVANGVNMKELQMKLLLKIEELTLYTIEQEKSILELKDQAKQNAELKQEVEALKLLITQKLK